MNMESIANKDVDYNSKSKMGAMAEDTVKDTVHEIGKRVGDTASHVVDSTASRYNTGRMYVKKHPVTGVFAAAAVGMVLGSVLTATLRKSV